MGTVYLIHIDPPLHHARHYLGWTNNLNGRVDRHEAGRGSPLVKAAMAAGSKIQLVRTWSGDRALERRLKNRKNSGQLCPICIELARKATHATRTVRNGPRDGLSTRQ